MNNKLVLKKKYLKAFPCIKKRFPFHQKEEIIRTQLEVLAVNPEVAVTMLASAAVMQQLD